ncbi:MAG: aminotransferase class IV [Candidatus Promineifilaceae bacterium]|jgi:branched-subunit amino acid aminotransferase/4-amino-4-deoxychorismate lyase
MDIPTSIDIDLYSIDKGVVNSVSQPRKEYILGRLYNGIPAGVYTVFRSFEHNKFLHLNDHLDRLDQSMALLGWKYRLDRGEICRALHAVCTQFDKENSRVRIDVLDEVESASMSGLRILLALTPFHPIPQNVYTDGVQVGIEEALRRNQPRVKRAEFAVHRRKYLERDPSRYECLLTDSQGAILEGTTSNFFAMRAGTLYTAGANVLEGIARKIILKLADKAAIPVVLEAVKMEELSDCSETAMSSASRGLVPIVRIGDLIIGEGRPGPISQRLIADYTDYVGQNIKTAV